MVIPTDSLLDPRTNHPESERWIWDEVRVKAALTLTIPKEG